MISALRVPAPYHLGTETEAAGASIPSRCRNVTLVWLGPGSYPGALPATGVAVTANVAIWDNARADWLRRHGFRQDDPCVTR